MTVTMGGRSVRTAPCFGASGFAAFPGAFPPDSGPFFSSGRRTKSTLKAFDSTPLTFSSAGAVAGTISPAPIKAFTASALDTPIFSAAVLIVALSPTSTVRLPGAAPAPEAAPASGEDSASSTSCAVSPSMELMCVFTSTPRSCSTFIRSLLLFPSIFANS